MSNMCYLHGNIVYFSYNFFYQHNVQDFLPTLDPCDLSVPLIFEQFLVYKASVTIDLWAN